MRKMGAWRLTLETGTGARHEHGAARHWPAAVFLLAHVVEEVVRAVDAEGFDNVLRGFAAEHDVRADEERRAWADDLEVGCDDDAIIEQRERVVERDDARLERVFGKLREREYDVSDRERCARPPTARCG